MANVQSKIFITSVCSDYLSVHPCAIAQSALLIFTLSRSFGHSLQIFHKHLSTKIKVFSFVKSFSVSHARDDDMKL